MPNHTHHSHDAACIASNENSELCCIVDTDNAPMLRDARLRVVSVADLTIPTFTADDDDALAIVRASRPDLASYAMTVTFTDHDDDFNPYR